MKIVLLMLLSLTFSCGAVEKVKNAFDGDDKVEIQAKQGKQGEKGDTGEAGIDGVSQTGVEGKQGDAGQAGKNGQAGKDGISGTDGENCEITDTDKDYYTITCGDNTVTVDKPQHCSLNNSDSDDYYTITCGDQTMQVEKPVQQLLVCTFVNWYTVETVLADIEDINNGTYDIVHVGACILGSVQQSHTQK